MSIHWTLRTVPVLGELPKAERRSVFRELTRTHVSEARRLFYAMPAGIGAGLGIFLGYRLSGSEVVAIVLGGFGAWIGSGVGRNLLIRRIAPHLAELGATRQRKQSEA